MKNTGLAGFHPAACLVYFLAVTVLSVTVLHPAFVVISLVFSLALALRTGRGRALGLTLKYVLPLMLLAAMLNPAFNHRGMTILAYLPGGNPLTLESLAYGLAAAMMLGAVLLWFFSLGRLMPAHRLSMVFGGGAPSLTLLLSMTLRFVPRFAQGFRRVWLCQVGLRGGKPAGLRDKLSLYAWVLSAMVTWTLENSVETVDSMKSRGHGLGRASSFSPTPFTARDGAFLAFTLLTAGLSAGLVIWGGVDISFFPALSFGGWAVFAAAGVFLALCAAPLILDVLEASRWKRSELKI